MPHISASVLVSKAKRQLEKLMPDCRYEETPQGQLRPQPPPEGTIFTGEKTSRVGPGQYEPAVGAVRPDPKAAVFGRGPEIDRTAYLLGTSAAPGVLLLFVTVRQQHLMHCLVCLCQTSQSD